MRIVGKFREQQCVDGERAAYTHADGRAVRRSLCDRIGAEVAARAGFVLYDERTRGVFMLQAIRHQARHDVGRRSCAERHDNSYGFPRPILRRRCGRE